jgi:hypothetical protein
MAVRKSRGEELQLKIDRFLWADDDPVHPSNQGYAALYEAVLKAAMDIAAEEMSPSTHNNKPPIYCGRSAPHLLRTAILEAAARSPRVRSSGGLPEDRGRGCFMHRGPHRGALLENLAHGRTNKNYFIFYISRM